MHKPHSNHFCIYFIFFFRNPSSTFPTSFVGPSSGPSYRYQLVLMDNLMPVMDGVTATKHMRKQCYPFLIAGVTGNVMDDDVAEYLDAGADIVFAKPVRLNSIMKLMQLIDARGPTRVQGEGSDNTNPLHSNVLT